MNNKCQIRRLGDNKYGVFVVDNSKFSYFVKKDKHGNFILVPEWSFEFSKQKPLSLSAADDLREDYHRFSKILKGMGYD